MAALKTTSGTRHDPSHSAIAGLVLALFLLGILVYNLPASRATAQDALVITPRSSADSSFIGPYSFITNRKPGSDTTEADIAQMQRDNKLGTLLGSNTLRIPTTYRQVWVTFAINNRTDSDRWMISFGDVMDGRLALVSKISIYNDLTKETVIHGQDLNGKFFGSAIPITLKPQAETLIVMQIEGERGFPLTITPKLISEEEYIRSLLTANIFNTALYVCFVFVIFAYLGFYLRTGGNEYLAYMLYFLLLGLVYTFTDITFHAPSIFAGESMVGVYALACAIAVVATRRYLEISRDETPTENKIILSCLGILGLAVAAHMTILNQDDLGFLVVNIGVAICFAGLVVVGALAAQRKEIFMKYFCGCWTLAFLSASIMALISYGTLPASPIMIGIFWYLIPLQALFLIDTHLHDLRIETGRHEKERLRRLHEEQAISRLQMAKESEDQAKLLKIIERERQAMNELREREIQRTEEMRLAKIMAEKANQAKSTFLAVVSHEIRTPMTGIMGMIQLIRDTVLTSKQAEYIDTIKLSGDAMMTLLNDLLDYEKIEHGSMRIERVPFDLHQLAKDITTLMSSNAERKGLTLILDVKDSVPRAVYGDPSRLRQVLLNLIGNAIKFTEKGHVILQVSTIITDNGAPLLGMSVSDTGIGISPSAQLKLFTPFTQADDSTSRKYGGTGLGLSISGKLIEAMGSKIRLVSEEGKGSTFSFALPLEAYSGDLNVLSPRVEAKRQDTRPMRILVVEDNEINRKVLGGLLTKLGHTPLFAVNGVEGLDMARKHQPDVILMDIQMQGLNGVDATKTLRTDQNDRIASIPVIALTGNVQSEDVMVYYAANLNGFIGKPIDPEVLAETLHNASIGVFENPVRVNNKVEPNIAAAEPSAPARPAVFAATPPQPQQTAPQKPVRTLATEDDSDLSPIQRYALANRAEITGEPEINISPAPAEDYDALDFKLDPNAPKLSIPPQHTQPQFTPHAEQPFVAAPNPKPSIFGQKPPAAPSASEPVAEPDLTPVPPKPLPEETASIIEQYLDVGMLANLANALGRTQFENLLIGFQDKSVEIIEAIEQIIPSGDLKQLGTRAHDLKGMAGNFGMAELSKTAGDIERAAKTDQGLIALEKSRRLRGINEQTKIALTQWIAQAQQK